MRSKMRRSAQHDVPRFVLPRVLGTLIAAFGVAGVCAAQDGDSPGRNRVFVKVSSPVRRTLSREMRIPASVVADEQVDLYAKTSGYADEIAVDIGSRVEKGDVLVHISVPEMSDELGQAQAVLLANQAKVRALQAKAVQAQRMVETADAEVDRYEAQLRFDEIKLSRQQRLHEGNAIPEQMLDDARATHAASTAQLHIAQAQAAGALAERQSAEADAEVAQSQTKVTEAKIARMRTLMGYASIRAPFDGIITDRWVDHGAFIRSAAEGNTTPLVRIAKTDRVRIALDVPELDTPHVGRGTAAKIDVKALRGDAFAATVSRTAGAIDPETRTMRAEIDLDNKDGRLTPGMYALVVLTLDRKEHAMVVPSRALRADADATYVLVSANGVATAKPVKIGYDDGIWTEILSGLDDSDQIITSTSGSVTAGTGVSPVTTGS